MPEKEWSDIVAESQRAALNPPAPAQHVPAPSPEVAKVQQESAQAQQLHPVPEAEPAKPAKPVRRRRVGKKTK